MLPGGSYLEPEGLAAVLAFTHAVDGVGRPIAGGVVGTGCGIGHEKSPLGGSSRAHRGLDGPDFAAALGGARLRERTRHSGKWEGPVLQRSEGGRNRVSA